MCPARILVADDHEIVRQGLRALIQEHPQWELVAEATDGRDAVDKASELKPDIAIVDITMPSLNGLEAAKQMLKLNPPTKILIFTMHDSELAMQKAVNAGARGYVLKADAGRDIVRAVQALLNGQTFFTQKAAQIILDEFTGKRPSTPEGYPQALTAKEREILQLFVEGKTIKQVVALLGLATKAVETYRTDLMHKFSCNSASELVRYAVRNRLVQA
jgi:DNA-binding NarL/FixJ family response regulator